MFSILNYSKSYQSEQILAFKEAEFDKSICLVQGVNGSGKTTLFKSISGIIPFEGDCLINNVSLKQHPIAYRKLINYCEAEPKFPPFLTGKELVQFVAKTKGTEPKKLDKLTAEFGLDLYWKSPVETYSSGMLKKISLTMTFCGTPSVILLDEPFTTIDQQSTQLLCRLINDYNQQGCTFIISAHQIKETIPLKFDRTLLIDNRTLQKQA